MKKLITLLLSLCVITGFSQVPAYYSSVDFTQPSASIHSQLSTLITATHTAISYSECWDALKEGDLDQGSSTMVALIYGYDDGDGNVITDRTRAVNSNGGNVGDWNREHVFPKSLGNPALGTSGPGSDAHNLRASDVQQNGNRDNKMFSDGSGNAATTGSDWYPGDEWKGDCARIVMYMYLRYGNQCIPINVATGSINSQDGNMANLLLDWNNDDPVSQFEKDRNDAIQNWQENRNPFIDNPRIAYKIWGGPMAEDTWGNLAISTISLYSEINVYPIPLNDGILYVSGISNSDVKSLQLHSVSGQIVQQLDLNQLVLNGGVSMDSIESGTYILSFIFEETVVKKKVIIQ